MLEKEIVINDPVGIHARPAAELMKEMSSYKSTIIITKEGKSANIKSLLQLMGLGVKEGETVKVTVEGEDEEKAMEAFLAFAKDRL